MKESFSEMLLIQGWLWLGAVWGTIARVGIKNLGNYIGHLVLPSVWEQFIGCILMGLFFNLRSSMIVDNDIKKNQSKRTSNIVYIGITTGFCGSLTSYSAWLLDLFEAMDNSPAQSFTNIEEFNTNTNNTNNNIFNRGRGYNLFSTITVLIVTTSMSIFGFQIGYDISTFIKNIKFLSIFFTNFLSYGNKKNNNFYKPIHFLGFSANIIEYIGFLLGFISWIVSAIIAGCIKTNKSRNYTLAAAFGPFGTILRWYLARKFNNLNKNFPWGTFAANQIATLILCILIIIQMSIYYNASNYPGSTHEKNFNIGCLIINCLINGIVGCLSTISTFTAELFTLNRKYAWIYFISTLFPSLCLVIIFLGTQSWGYNPIVSLC